MSTAPLVQLTLNEERDAIIERLRELFARDEINVDSLEHAIELVEQANSHEELVQIRKELDAVAPPAQTMPTSEALVPASDVARDTQRFIAIFGGSEHKGQWRPKPKIRSISVFGGTSLDFTEAQLPPGDIEINLTAVLGGAEIKVPDDVAVDWQGVAILGGYTQSGDPPARVMGPSRIVIRGFCVLGGVEVKVRARHKEKGLLTVVRSIIKQLTS
jgi:hypothetical protein